MKIAIGTDHRGYSQKELLKRDFFLVGQTIEWIDCGAYTDERSDYPMFAFKVVRELLQGSADYGILLCATGIGMAIAANRFDGIYAALAWNDRVAQAAKEDDNANILVLPSDYMNDQMLLASVQVWLLAAFKGGRYQQRISQIDALRG